MTNSRGMRRLLSVLEAQEDWYSAQMEAALADLKRLQLALETAAHRERQGRRLIGASALSGELAERLVGLEETRGGRSQAEVLKPQMVSAEAKARARRQEFLSKRSERRKVEEAMKRAEAIETRNADHASQRMVDDLYLNRLRQDKR